MSPRQLRFFQNRQFLLSLPNARLVLKKKDAYGVEFQIRSGLYTLLIEHIFGYEPRIYVVNPIIDMSNSITIHTYGLRSPLSYSRKLPRICVTLPQKHEWDGLMGFNETIVPWAIEWTEFYELWLISGEWHGGGVHPTDGGKNKDEGSKSAEQE